MYCVFQEVMSVADVILWAALFPLLSDTSFEAGELKCVCVCE